MFPLKPFEILYNNHSVEARKLILDDEIKSPQQLSKMSDDEVAEIINQHYGVLIYQNGDYILARKEDVSEVLKYFIPIQR